MSFTQVHTRTAATPQVPNPSTPNPGTWSDSPLNPRTPPIPINRRLFIWGQHYINPPKPKDPPSLVSPRLKSEDRWRGPALRLHPPPSQTFRAEATRWTSFLTPSSTRATRMRTMAWKTESAVIFASLFGFSWLRNTNQQSFCLLRNTNPTNKQERKQTSKQTNKHSMQAPDISPLKLGAGPVGSCHRNPSHEHGISPQVLCGAHRSGPQRAVLDLGIP